MLLYTRGRWCYMDVLLDCWPGGVITHGWIMGLNVVTGLSSFKCTRVISSFSSGSGVIFDLLEMFMVSWFLRHIFMKNFKVVQWDMDLKSTKELSNRWIAGSKYSLYMQPCLVWCDRATPLLRSKRWFIIAHRSTATFRDIMWNASAVLVSLTGLPLTPRVEFVQSPVNNHTTAHLDNSWISSSVLLMSSSCD